MARAQKVNLPVSQGMEDKKTAVEVYFLGNGYNPGSILYAGNDVNDLAAMKCVGY